MATTTIRVMHNGWAITRFVRERFEFAEYDVDWREQPVLSNESREFNANRQAGDSLREIAAHRPKYYGIPWIEYPDGRKSHPAGAAIGTQYPTVWTWEGADGPAVYSIPRHGQETATRDGIYKIKYDFPPRNSQPINHDKLARILDSWVDGGATAAGRNPDEITVDDIRLLCRNRP
jgi:hypothetical protein